MSEHDLFKLGDFYINIFVVSGLFEYVSSYDIRSANDDDLYPSSSSSPLTTIKLTEKVELDFYIHPYVLPMVCPPTPWGDDKIGGYLTNSDSLVHSSSFAAHSSTDIPYDIINRMQNTPYSVNRLL